MPKILIIDDDPHVALSLKVWLEEASYEATVANTGREGLATLKNTAFDLLLLDIIMPEMDGIEVIMELKKAQSKIKIIAISGGGRGYAQDYLNVANVLGADRSFTKPIKMDLLETAIYDLTGGDDH